MKGTRGMKVMKDMRVRMRVQVVRGMSGDRGMRHMRDTRSSTGVGEVVHIETPTRGIWDKSGMRDG